MGEKRIGQSQPGKEETGTLTTKPGCGDREDDAWMNFKDWWENYLNAAGGGDCQPTDVAGAIAEAASWLNPALQECSARANALLPVMNKADDQDTLSALLQESAGEDPDKFMLARWGYRFLLEADNISEIYRQRNSDDDQGNRVDNISQAARDPNPAANRYPVLTDADFATLCYPAIDETSRGSRQLSKSARSHRQRRASEVIENLADKGYCTMESVAGGLRIMPPDGWGAGFNG